MKATYFPFSNIVRFHSPLDGKPIQRKVQSRAGAEAYAQGVAGIYNCSVRLVSATLPIADLGTFYPIDAPFGYTEATS